MNKPNLTVVAVGVILLMVMSVISFMVYDAMSQKNPYYISQEFEVEGMVGGEHVTGISVSEWNNHSGAGDIIQYPIELKGLGSVDFEFYIYFDDSGKPSDSLYKYDESKDRWVGTESSKTVSFQVIDSKKIDNAEITTEEATLFLKEVVS